MISNATRAAVVSDIHLGVHQNSEKWLKESLRFAEWLRNELNNKGIEDIIIPGDFFHDRTDINLLTLHYASKIFDVWKDFQIWMIPGNHDCYFKDNSTVSSVNIFKLYHRVRMFDQPSVVDFSGKKLVFVPWGTPVDQVPQGDCIIGHFELNGFKMNTFKVCEGHDESEHLLDKAPLILTGHFHTRQERKSKKGRVVYVGTPYEMDYNDMNVEKGYHVIDFSTLDLQFVLYPHTVKHKKIKLTDLAANKANLNEYLEKEVKGNVITFIVDKEIELDKVNALVQKLQMFEPLGFKGTDMFKKEQTGIDVQNLQVNLQIEQLITEFINQMALENSADVLKLVLELYGKYKTA